MNFTRLTEYLDSLQSNYKIPGGDCIICQNHETLYRHSFGFSDYEKQKPVDRNDIYMLFSASKIITITAVLQLIEQEKLHLYDPLTDFSRNFPFCGLPMISSFLSRPNGRTKIPPVIWRTIQSA